MFFKRRLAREGSEGETKAQKPGLKARGIMRFGTSAMQVKLATLSENPAVLARLSESRDPRVREAAALSEYTPHKNLTSMTQDEDDAVRMAVGMNRELPDLGRAYIIRDPNVDVRLSLVANEGSNLEFVIEAIESTGIRMANTVGTGGRRSAWPETWGINLARPDIYREEENFIKILAMLRRLSRGRAALIVRKMSHHHPALATAFGWEMPELERIGSDHAPEARPT
jgi:hypothetical protein